MFNKILLIVESPSKCKKIVSLLGEDKYACVATMGHMTELTSLEDIDYTFLGLPMFHIMRTKQDQINKIKSLIANHKETYLMTDNDREGAGIAYHACCLFNLPVETTKRIIFNEITKPALEHAIACPQTLNMDLVHAQIARQILDMSVGFKITPLLWKCIANGNLSAGRCQTPALRLVYDNQSEIDSTQEEVVFETTGFFTKLNLKYDLNKRHTTDETCCNFLKDSSTFQHVIHAPEIKEFTREPPLPFTTSTLQQQASNELNFSPKETMSICQRLYEEGHITYPRTDSRVYSDSFMEHASRYITETWGELYNRSSISGKENNKKKRIIKKKTVIEVNESCVHLIKPQEAHEAIHVTSLNFTGTSSELSAKEQRLYKMIWRHSVETCMTFASGRILTSKISAPHNLVYQHTVERFDFLGWLVVSKPSFDSTNWEFFNSFECETIIKYNKLQSQMMIRNIKSHYSEASLISTLEEKGIGRPSTFSNLIHKIQERGYVLKTNVVGREHDCVNYELTGTILDKTIKKQEFGNEKNKLVIQPLGNIVLDFLCSNFDELFNYDFTKYMEHQLDQISCGNKKWNDVCAECTSHIDHLVSRLNSEKKTLPLADGKHEVLVGKFGPLIKNISTNTFQPLPNKVDYNHLKSGLCKIEDLVHPNQTTNNKYKYLGKYNDYEIFLRTGTYGPYITWGENKYSLLQFKNDESCKNVDDIPFSYNDAIQTIEKKSATKTTNNQTILRDINNHLSIRNGQYGYYIYYKNDKMKSPAFISLRGFKSDWKTCDTQLIIAWVNSQGFKNK